MMGGMFGSSGFALINEDTPSFLEGPCLQLVTARSGIFLLCKLLKPGRVWLPAYLCHSMVESVKFADTNIEFYPVSVDLKLAELDWTSKVRAGDIVVCIDYFGFESETEVHRAVKERDAWLVQDAAQALLSEYERPQADFVLYSPRKFLGLPDGGIIQSTCNEDFASVQLQSAPSDFVLASCDAFYARTKQDGAQRRIASRHRTAWC